MKSGELRDLKERERQLAKQRKRAAKRERKRQRGLQRAAAITSVDAAIADSQRDGKS